MDIQYDGAMLPRLQMFKIGQAESVLKAFHASVLGPNNKNLSPLKKVWLRLHHILGHPSFSLVQQLAAGGWFDAKALGLSQLPPNQAPMCEACKYGKQHRLPDKTTTTSNVGNAISDMRHYRRHGLKWSNKFRRGAGCMPENQSRAVFMCTHPCNLVASLSKLQAGFP